MGAYQAKESLINICACTGSGDYEEVKKILDRNPSLINQDLSDTGGTVLHYACGNNRTKIIEYLLSLPQINVNQQDKSGRTPLFDLMMATEKNCTESLKLLLQHAQIDPNIQTKQGYAPIHVASSENCVELMKLLLSNDKVDVNIKDEDGCTPLHYASSKAHIEVMELLLSHPNIDNTIRNNRRELAIDVCCRQYGSDRCKKPRILELLKEK